MDSQVETELMYYKALEKELMTVWRQTKNAFHTPPTKMVSIPKPDRPTYRNVQSAIGRYVSECEGNVPSER
jgi:hypothetical protein